MLLIKNIFLYDPASGVEKKTDILIEDGRFAKIEDNISPEECPRTGRQDGEDSPLQVIDGAGLCAAPGLIDTQRICTPGRLPQRAGDTPVSS